MNSAFDRLLSSKNVAIFTHISPDGDAVGSSFAMAEILREINIESTVFINDNVPKRLEFLCDNLKGEYLTKFVDKGFDTYLSLDCGDLKRLGIYSDIFSSKENTVNIDHHGTNPNFAKENYVVGDIGSTGEIVFEFSEYAKVSVNKNIANLLYAAISSDTGCFKYQATTPKTYIIGARLIENGADFSTINKLLFDTDDFKELKLRGYAIDNLELFLDGKAAIVVITDEVLKKYNAVYEDAENLSTLPRSIRGVEVGLVIKEKDGKARVSIRTNEYVDASALAKSFGGGGHIRAAGITFDGSVFECKEKLLEELKKLI